VGANNELFDASLRHAIDLQRVTAGDIGKLNKTLDEAERELVARLRTGLSQDMTRARLSALLNDVRVLRKELFRKLQGQNTADMTQLSRAEANVTGVLLNKSLGLNLEFAAVSARTLQALVTEHPFSGGANAARTLEQWWIGLEAADARRIHDAIMMGMIQGETVDQMVARVRKTTALTRLNAAAVVRTAANHVSNASRMAFFEENSQLIRALRWVSTLDGRTTPVCMARDGHYSPLSGKSTKGVPRPWLSPLTARPPAHPACRSNQVAILDDVGLADMLPDRPYVADVRTGRRREIDFRADAKARVGATRWSQMSTKQIDSEIRAEKLSWSTQHIGQVPGKMNYDEWLRTQPHSFQNQVLGNGKAELFRKGLRLDRYVDRAGNELTLDQLIQLTGG